jgi:hypothetical protein
MPRRVGSPNALVIADTVLVKARLVADEFAVTPILYLCA